MMGNSKHQQHVYVHGSINGYLERDIETYTPKKFFYIKIEKSGHKYYLGAENNLVDESHAVNFSEKRVLEIIMEMKENPYYKNCEILPFETSRKLRRILFGKISVIWNISSVSLDKVSNTTIFLRVRKQRRRNIPITICIPTANKPAT